MSASHNSFTNMCALGGGAVFFRDESPSVSQTSNTESHSLAAFGSHLAPASSGASLRVFGPSKKQPSSQPLSPTFNITLLDEFGNVVKATATGLTASVALAILAQQTQYQLSLSGPQIVPFVNGVATFSGLVVSFHLMCVEC